MHRVVIINIGICVGILSIPFLFDSTLPGHSDHSFSNPLFVKDVVSYIICVAIYLLNYYVFLPKYFFLKRYFIYITILVASFVVLTQNPYSRVRPTRPMHKHEAGHIHAQKTEKSLVSNFHVEPSVRLNILRFSWVILISFLFRIMNRLKDVENEKLESELSFLKAQFHPHFLFNTLNGIYSLAIQQSNHTADAIARLSGMMRYMLKDTNQDFVLLKDELEYLTNYVELQKIRFDQTANIDYQVHGMVDYQKICPNILITFVENAFKHGISPETESNVSIEINVAQQKLDMTVRNQKLANISLKEDVSGLGITNTIKRLELVYPNQHNLVIDDMQDKYQIHLQIDLA